MDQRKDSALLSYLKVLPDPRQVKGRRYAWWVLLAIICAAILSGQSSGRGIAQWAAWRADEIMASLGHAIRHIPSASTIRRALHQVDPQTLERAIARLGRRLDKAKEGRAYVIGPEGERLRGQALDGKEVRGANAHGEAVTLVSLVCHGSGLVLAQQQVADKGHEITCAPQLLRGQNLKGTVTTFDAAHTHRPLAQQIIAQQGDYLMVVKKNQRRLYTDLQTFFADPALPRAEDDRDG